MILTGGFYNKTQVTVYSSSGWVEYQKQAQLQTGRWNHACGHFVNTDNQVVRQQHYTDNIHLCGLHHHGQVYLVAGGHTGSSYTDTTETLEQGASAWTYAGPLRRAMSYLQAVYIDKIVISTGEIISYNS